MRITALKTARLLTILNAAERLDWQAILLRGSAPCFALREDARFCGRDSESHNVRMHKFVPFEEFTRLLAHRVTLDNDAHAAMLFTAHGQPFIIDLGDVERVTPYQWQAAAVNHRYLTADINGRRLLLHRFLMDAQPGQTVDHINGNTIDNRRSNLRICSTAENTRNTRKLARAAMVCTSQYKGVSFRSDRKRWTAYIGTGKERWMLGCYSTEREAALAYNKAAIERYGQFASLNDIEPVEDFVI